MKPSGKRILWVDDEIDLLKPHLLFLQARGYHVDAITNGDDSLVLMRENAYDLVLLDEQMPGRSGLEVLEIMRREDPHIRVVMVTKSAEDQTMTDAIGRRVADYLVKPTSPRQVLSVVTRILEGSTIRQQRTAQDFAARFGQLSRAREEARTPANFAELYIELTGWHVSLEETEERGLLDTVQSLMTDLRSDFGRWVGQEYPGWLRDEGDRPLLSVDIVREHVLPLLGPSPVFLVVLDCMRLDQWRVIAPLLAPYFEIEESYHYSILPTATPYARNAIFSGQFPDEISRDHPGWWNKSDDEGSLNAFEDELLKEQLQRLVGRHIPVHYEKIFTDKQEDQVRGRVRSALKTAHSVIAMVFNFVDLMTHGRSESPILMEVAKDEAALRGLTRAWFTRSTVFSVLKEAAAAGHKVIMTTDHGSILCQRPATVFARRDATSNLRYKFGQDLRTEKADTAFSTSRSEDLRFPEGKLGVTYALAVDDYFFVYPTKLREYQRRYRNSFLHGGISPEEMIVPIACLTPRRRGSTRNLTP
ncbi:MAG: response regulator [Gemmatimonadetes bacterium]|nr:response regulator [Gemmatimonadota bacterium]